ncbi:hypothetical protein [Sporosarcina beigongshangi]|uniref:hypothetical protein n=1 Tax=Sporosarcina beigongshangi TaxID=2782538 RepID=UPI0019398E34|nr:hypothetical protein [Sporosarcina beigongshangi]
MNRISMVEDLLKDSFKILNGFPYYIAIEENESTHYDHGNWLDEIRTLIDFAIQSELNRVSALINRSSEHYLYLSKMLISLGFEQYASKIEVFRDLHDINSNVKGYEWRSLSDSTISEEEFKNLWKDCMSGSENSVSSLTIDEHLSSVQSELGEKWRKSCKAIYLEGRPIGVSMPHIEPGTVDEGRLFYFGLIPEERGKGQSAIIHYQSMYLLKLMGATYYIGSTHETNKKMQKVFSRNGCSIRARMESYYKYLDS